MSETIQVTYSLGHPWEGRGGFEQCQIVAATTDSLDAAIENAGKYLWRCWIVGNVPVAGQYSAVMYRPSGAKGPWDDTYGSHLPAMYPGDKK